MFTIKGETRQIGQPLKTFENNKKTNAAVIREPEILIKAQEIHLALTGEVRLHALLCKINTAGIQISKLNLKLILGFSSRTLRQCGMQQFDWLQWLCSVIGDTPQA